MYCHANNPEKFHTLTFDLKYQLKQNLTFGPISGPFWPKNLKTIFSQKAV